MSLTRKEKLIELKQQNPFFQCNALQAMQFGAKSASTQTAFNTLVEAAYKEQYTESVNAKTTINLEGFFTHLIEIGDITNRQHRAFGKHKVDNGGHAARKQHTWAMIWLLHKDIDLWCKMLPVFVAFTGLNEVVRVQVRTDKKGKTIKEVWGLMYELYRKNSGLSESQRKRALDAILSVAKTAWNSGDLMERMSVSKSFVLPRSSDRSRMKKGERVKRPLQTLTKEIHGYKSQFLEAWCTLMGFEIDNSKGFKHFTGWIKARAPYVQDTEYYLFSTGKIRDFDQVQFMDWLNGSLNGRNIPKPNDHAVRCRLMNKDNTPKLEEKFDSKGKPTKEGAKPKWDTASKPFSKWFLSWEQNKLKAQEEERKLNEKVRTGTATKEDEIRLKEVSKEAKTKVHSATIPELVNKAIESGYNTDQLDLNAHGILERMKTNAPIMCCVDVSSSMNGRPAAMAALMTTIMMLKNPSTDYADVLMTFGAKCDVYVSGYKNVMEVRRAGLTPTRVNFNSLVDRTATFSKNHAHIANICTACQGNTDIDSIWKGLNDWYKDSKTDGERQVKRETIANYPTLFIISDGDFNNRYNAKASLQALIDNMRNTFGWEGFVVVWDVTRGSDNKYQTFNNMTNVLHMSGDDPTAISRVFEKLSNVDVVDTFIAMRTLWQSNRYDLVKQVVHDYYESKIIRA